MKILIYIVSSVLLFLSPFFGEINLNFSDILNQDSMTYTVFWDLRIPRIILAFFVGGVLALGGLIFQIVFKNQLITPYTLGISSGTTLFTAISIVFFPFINISISAIFGSILTVMILYYISRVMNKSSIAVSTNSLLLTGIALSYFYASALMLVFYMSNLQENYSIVRFTLGSLDTVGYFNSIVMLVISLIFYFVINFYKKDIRLLLISNDTAFLKGLNVNRLNIVLLVLVSLCVGISISFVGPIGFIGLVIPHIVKLLYKQSADKLFFPVFFYGGVF